MLKVILKNKYEITLNYIKHILLLIYVNITYLITNLKSIIMYIRNIQLKFTCIYNNDMVYSFY